jgi:hypothetical protein
MVNMLPIAQHTPAAYLAPQPARLFGRALTLGTGAVALRNVAGLLRGSRIHPAGLDEGPFTRFSNHNSSGKQRSWDNAAAGMNIGLKAVIRPIAAGAGNNGSDSPHTYNRCWSHRRLQSP